MGKTKIEWTHRPLPDGSFAPGYTFNPWWGCTKVSPGCKLCYAETLSKRTGFDIWGPTANRRFFGDKHWNEPLRWNREAQERGEPSLVFCGSMCDIMEIHDDTVIGIGLDIGRTRLWSLIDDTPWLIWLLLTKRPENAFDLLPKPWRSQLPFNVWFGVSAENQARMDERAPILLQIPTLVRWFSLEPLLEDVRTPMWSDWNIVGGESGAGCRPMELEWARNIRHASTLQETPLFMKQLGGFPDKRDDIEQFPPDLRVREFPPIFPP
jgi:protein gp37